MSQSRPFSLIHFAHVRLKAVLTVGDSVIDATVGNGHDTCFLAELVGPNGRVYGFDIQNEAIESARKLLFKGKSGDQVELILAGHETMQTHIPAALHGAIGAVMFNLGYLPGSDKRITTQSETTSQALTSALTLLRRRGMLSVMAYPGHPGGLDETQVVRHWMASIEGQGHSVAVERTHPKLTAPELWLVTKG